MSRSTRVTHLSQVYLATILVVFLVCVVTVVVMTTPSVRVALAHFSEQSSPPVINLSADPKVGAKIKIPKLDAFNRTIVLGDKTLLVYAGPCSECTLKAFKPDEVEGNFDSLVVYFDADARILPKQYSKLPSRVYILADPKSEWASLLNAQWFPRMYLLDSDSRLIGLQLDPSRLPDFVTRLSK